jgi:hypothetical protein
MSTSIDKLIGTFSEAVGGKAELPDLCMTALKLRKKQQDADRDRAGDGWVDTGLVFTTRRGTPIEPRSFDRCIIATRVQGRRHDGDLHRSPCEATREALRKLSDWLA